MADTTLAPYLVIGEITKPQGVRGELKVRPITNDPARFEALTQVFLLRGGAYVPVAIACTRIDQESVYLRMDGVTDRDAADKLRGALLYVDRANAVPLAQDENFICDLIGCRAFDTRGTEIGELTEVLQPGGNDVYVFRTPQGELMVPALRFVVLSVDVIAKRIVLEASRLAEVAVYV